MPYLAGGRLHHLHPLGRREAVGDVLVALLPGRGVQVEVDLVLVHGGVDLRVHDGRMVLLLVVGGVVVVVVGVGVGAPVVGAVVVVGVAGRYHGLDVGLGAVEYGRWRRRGERAGDELAGTGVWKNWKK